MTPTLFTSLNEFQHWRLGVPTASSLALVPTMGALHAGHEQLIEKAKSLAKNVVVSIFINPLQFNDQDDLAKYPRTLQADIDICQKNSVDAIFAPNVEEIYPDSFDSKISAGQTGEIYEGVHRPGHFNGVLTVVDRIFTLLKPTVAVFGEKDFQQLVLIRQMASTRHPGIGIASVPTIRDHDGLAFSSRNTRLAPPERILATKLYESLCTIEHQFAAGMRDSRQLEATGRNYLGEFRDISLDYLVCVNASNLMAIDSVVNSAVVLLAATIGNVRLIDNILLNTLVR